jgi:DNA repair exonuclease SbcCD ATPase subunit
MKNKKLILALVLPLLTSGLLISCKPQKNNTPQRSSSPTELQTSANLPENNQNSEDLQKTLTEAETSLNNVEKSLESLNSKLKDFIDTKNNNIDFEPITDSWDQFKIAWKKLKSKLHDKSTVQLLINNLEQKINNFDKIMDFLYDTILDKNNQDIIEKLQKQLGMNLPEYGNFKQKTQEKLEDTTTLQIENIKNDLDRIKQNITDSLTSSNDGDIENKIEQLNQQIEQEKQNNTLLNQKIKTLENEKNVLIQQINDNKKIIFTLALLLCFMILGTAVIVLLLRRNKGKKFRDLGSRKRKNKTANNINDQEKSSLNSIDDILEIYHYRPEELSDYITRAVITTATLHGNREIVFEEDNKGHYWIIKRKDSDDLLLPKAKDRIDANAYLTFQRIFNCQEHPSHRDGFLTVHQPGTLTFDINKQEWTLKEKGRITFDKISLVNKLENKIKETQESLKQKNNEFNKLNRKSEQIQQDLKRKNDQLQSNLNKSEQEKQQLKSDLEKLSQQLSSLAAKVNVSQPHLTHSSLATKTAIITHQQELVSIYNANSLFKYNNTSIAVSTEPTSIETSRTGSGKRPIFTEQSPSKYWIVEIGRDLYLVPKENALNTNDMTSVEVLFECRGYKKDISNPKAFTLIKPGKVKEINGQWELIECGILDYR